MRTAVVLALILGSSSLASADDAPAPTDSAPDPAPAPAPATTPNVNAPGVTPPVAPPPVNIEVKATKRPGSVLHIPAPTQGQFAEKPKISKTPALIGTSVTGALLVASVMTYLKYEAVHKNVVTGNDTDPLNPMGSEIDRDRNRRQDQLDSTDRWKHITLGMFAATLISASVTGYLWSRHDAAGPTVNIEPSNSGINFGFHKQF